MVWKETASGFEGRKIENFIQIDSSSVLAFDTLFTSELKRFPSAWRVSRPIILFYFALFPKIKIVCDFASDRYISAIFRCPHSVARMIIFYFLLMGILYYYKYCKITRAIPMGKEIDFVVCLSVYKWHCSVSEWIIRWTSWVNRPSSCPLCSVSTRIQVKYIYFITLLVKPEKCVNFRVLYLAIVEK